jgi:hypothetical protein
MNVDRMVFHVTAAAPGVPISIAAALAATPTPGVYDLGTLVPGMPTTRCVLPAPGDPAGLLACLPAMLSVIHSGSLETSFNAGQVMAAYPGFVLKSTHSEAAALALAAWFELLRLDSNAVPFLAPALKRVPMELHFSARTYANAPFDFTTCPQKMLVPWNEVVPTYVRLMKLTPDTATPVMFCTQTAMLLWAAVKCFASVSASAGAGACAGAGAGVDSDSDSDASLVSRMVALQAVRGAMANLETSNLASLVVAEAVMKNTIAFPESCVKKSGGYASAAAELVSEFRLSTLDKHAPSLDDLLGSATLQGLVEKYVSPILATMQTLLDMAKSHMPRRYGSVGPVLADVNPSLLALQGLFWLTRNAYETAKFTDMAGAMIECAATAAHYVCKALNDIAMARRPAVASVTSTFSFSAIPEMCARGCCVRYRYTDQGTVAFPAVLTWNDLVEALTNPVEKQAAKAMEPRISPDMIATAVSLVYQHGMGTPRGRVARRGDLSRYFWS